MIFLFIILNLGTAPAFTSFVRCGGHGTLKERIKDCKNLNVGLSQVKTSENWAYRLATIDEDDRIYWYSEKTKKVWSPLIGSISRKVSASELKNKCIFPYKIPTYIDLKEDFEGGIYNVWGDDGVEYFQRRKSRKFGKKRRKARLYFSFKTGETDLYAKLPKNIKRLNLRCVADLNHFVLFERP